MKNRSRFIGLRNFIIITAVFLALLFAVDKLIPVFSFRADPEASSDSAGFLRLEKTPPESILTVAEARKMCRAYNVDISGYSINKYPLVNDMPSTEAVDGDTVNIVVIGDSFVWGDNSVNRNELFWRQAEHMLRAKGYNCSVTAIAMAAADAYEELQWYENYLEENRPDLVVFGYISNDPVIPQDQNAAAEEEDGDEEETPDLFPVLSPVRVLFPNIYQSLVSYIVSKTMYMEKYDDLLKDYDEEILKGEVRAYYQTHFVDKLDAITKETGIPSVVMTLPNLPGSPLYKACYKPLKDIYADTSVAFYDLYPAFDRFYSAKHKKNLFVNAGNDHPGSAAHYFYASFLTDLLESDFGAVLGEKQNRSLCSNVICVNECTPCGINLQTAAQSEKYAQYTFTYPERKSHTHLLSSTDQYWLTEPLGKRYIKLSFENPVDLTGLELTGAPAGKTELYYSKINEALGYDDNTLYPVVLTETGAALSGVLHDEKITSVCIHIAEDVSVPGELGLKING